MASRQYALMVQTTGDGGFHNLPALCQIVPDIRILILGHILPEIGIVFITPAKYVLHPAERIDILTLIPLAGLADISASYAEIRLLAQHFALPIVSLEIHTVWMLGQELLGSVRASFNATSVKCPLPVAARLPYKVTTNEDAPGHRPLNISAAFLGPIV